MCAHAAVLIWDSVLDVEHRQDWRLNQKLAARLLKHDVVAAESLSVNALVDEAHDKKLSSSDGGFGLGRDRCSRLGPRTTSRLEHQDARLPCNQKPAKCRLVVWEPHVSSTLIAYQWSTSGLVTPTAFCQHGLSDSRLAGKSLPTCPTEGPATSVRAWARVC
jgi:hypothetical protein